MAHTANLNQPVRAKVLTPIPDYSRVIALELHLAGGVGNDDYCYTPQLGNRLWLRGIDIWCYCAVAGALIGGFFYLTYGTHSPTSFSNVAVGWNRIIDLHCGQKPGFRWFEREAFHRSFTMNKLFEADGLRFGVALESFADEQWEATVAFQISEG